MVQKKCKAQLLFEKEAKTFDEMLQCKSQNNEDCESVDFTAHLTSSQATGDAGHGQFEAPAKECARCGSSAHCKSQLKNVSIGWR